MFVINVFCLTDFEMKLGDLITVNLTDHLLDVDIYFDLREFDDHFGATFLFL